MPHIVEPVATGGGPPPNRKRWTRQECDFLHGSGLLTARYELIDGEIIEKMPQKPPHAYVVSVLIAWLSSVFGALHVRGQSSIHVAASEDAYNEPEPDAAVTTHPAVTYVDHHPEPEDLLLVAEVSDTTIAFDRNHKASLYARARIGEYWVVDLVGRRLLVHRNPGPAGYGDVQAYAEEEMVTPIARPEAAIRVSELLPPA